MKTIENELLSKQVEKAFNQEQDKGLVEDDPHWDLFKINKQVNDAVVEAYNKGWKDGYRRGWMDQYVELYWYQFKYEKLQPYISKINGWANFLAEVKKHFSNI